MGLQEFTCYRFVKMYNPDFCAFDALSKGFKKRIKEAGLSMTEGPFDEVKQGGMWEVVLSFVGHAARAQFGKGAEDQVRAQVKDLLRGCRRAWTMGISIFVSADRTRDISFDQIHQIAPTTPDFRRRAVYLEYSWNLNGQSAFRQRPAEVLAVLLQGDREFEVFACTKVTEFSPKSFLARSLQFPYNDLVFVNESLLREHPCWMWVPVPRSQQYDYMQVKYLPNKPPAFVESRPGPWRVYEFTLPRFFKSNPDWGSKGGSQAELLQSLLHSPEAHAARERMVVRV